MKKVLAIFLAVFLFSAASVSADCTFTGVESSGALTANVYLDGSESAARAVMILGEGEDASYCLSDEIIPANTEGEVSLTFSGASATEGEKVRLLLWEVGENGALTLRPIADKYEAAIPKTESPYIAEFCFEPETSGENLSYGSKSAGYGATAGAQAGTALLFASVTGADYKAIEWSKDEYDLSGGTSIVPVMAASSKNPWGSPYFEVRLSTAECENIYVSAKLGGTKKGPRDYALQYSADGESFTTVAEYSVTDNKSMEQAFDNVLLPSDAADCEALYIRFAAASDSTISGALLTDEPTGGEAAICDIFIGGTPKESVSEETGNVIRLLGDSIDAEGVENAVVDGSTVTITAAGSYEVEGSLSDGQIIVNLPAKSDKAEIILSGVNVSSSVGSPFCAALGKVTLVLSEGTENVFTDPSVYTDETGNACVYSKNDLTIKGSGSLLVNGNSNNGIGSKADLEITGGRITVASAPNNGIKGNNSVTIDTDNTISVTCASDGIKSDTIDEDGKGYVDIENGTINITTTGDGDGIQADLLLTVNGGDITINSASDGIKANGAVAEGAISDGKVLINGGTLDITAFNDAVQAEGVLEINGGAVTAVTHGGSGGGSTEDSCKGLKSGTETIITGGTFVLDTRDDSVHSNGTTKISGGRFELTSGDDGIHSDTDLTITENPYINITKSYEGLEALTINIGGGDIRLVATDDGVNAAGGNDQSNISENRPGMNGGFGSGGFGPGGGVPGQTTSGSGYLSITGGRLYVNASGDGLDANGSISISGGTILVDGPTASGNGALDFDSSCSVTGGLLIAASSGGMEQTPSGTQYGVNVSFGSAQSANTIVSLRGADGEDVLTYAPAKNYKTIIISSPLLAKGGTYSLYSGGSCSGECETGLYSGGSYSGTLKKTFTITNTMTNVSA